MKIRESKETLGLPWSHPVSPSSPTLPAKLLWTPRESSGEHHESRFVLFPWKKTGCQELWSLWDGESSKKSVPGELCWGDSAFPASFGLSVLFWEFGPQSLTAFLLEGSMECVGGQVGGGGAWVSAQTYTTQHGCPGLRREGEPCAEIPGNSQRGRIHRHACGNKQRWKRLAVLIFHPDSFSSRDCMGALWLEWLIMLSCTWNAYIPSNHFIFAFTQKIISYLLINVNPSTWKV